MIDRAITEQSEPFAGDGFARGPFGVARTSLEG
jgi:hypothetical protein